MFAYMIGQPERTYLRLRALFSSITSYARMTNVSLQLTMPYSRFLQEANLACDVRIVYVTSKAPILSV